MKPAVFVLSKVLSKVSVKISFFSAISFFSERKNTEKTRLQRPCFLCVLSLDACNDDSFKNEDLILILSFSIFQIRLGIVTAAPRRRALARSLHQFDGWRSIGSRRPNDEPIARRDDTAKVSLPKPGKSQ